MSFEVQELSDLIRLIVLLNLGRGDNLSRTQFKRKVENYLAHGISIEIGDIDEALQEMASEGLIAKNKDKFTLTDEGTRLGEEWKDLLVKEEPVFEIIAGLTDGTITALFVILSSLLAQLPRNIVSWAAIASLAAVAITNFSSFMLGGRTEDLANVLTLKTLMEYSVNDIPDKREREKSLKIVKYLSSILRKKRTKTNVLSSSICGTTTFLAGIIPITTFLMLPTPLDLALSFMIMGFVVGVFLIYYRTKKSKVHWKTTLIETLLVISTAVIASLIFGGL